MTDFLTTDPARVAAAIAALDTDPGNPGDVHFALTGETKADCGRPVAILANVTDRVADVTCLACTAEIAAESDARSDAS